MTKPVRDENLKRLLTKIKVKKDEKNSPTSKLINSFLYKL